MSHNSAGIPGTPYRIQLELINGKWTFRLLKGNIVIVSHVYEDDHVSGDEIEPIPSLFIGWVIRTIAIPNVNPYQIMKIIQTLVKQAIEQKEQKEVKILLPETHKVGLERVPESMLKKSKPIGWIKEEGMKTVQEMEEEKRIAFQERLATKKEEKQVKMVIYRFNDSLGTFENLITDPKIKLIDLLNEESILLFIDPMHYWVWLWYGRNITNRMKFIAAKTAQPIRDTHDITYKITAVDQGNEPQAFMDIINVVDQDDEKEMEERRKEEHLKECEQSEEHFRRKVPEIIENLNYDLEQIDEFRNKLNEHEVQFRFTVQFTFQLFERTIKSYHIDLYNASELLKVLNDENLKDFGKLKGQLNVAKGLLKKLEEKVANLRELNNHKKDNGERSPFPYVFKPPEPPDDLAPASQVNVKHTIEEEDLWKKSYCKHCGSLLPEGALTCPNCGKKV